MCGANPLRAGQRRQLRSGAPGRSGRDGHGGVLLPRQTGTRSRGGHGAPTNRAPSEPGDRGARCLCSRGARVGHGSAPCPARVTWRLPVTCPSRREGAGPPLRNGGVGTAPRREGPGHPRAERLRAQLRCSRAFSAPSDGGHWAVVHVGREILMCSYGWRHQ